ncbi:molybdopterin-dependent oxidoreductase [Tamlana agarivorans]|uniref:Molybdopterin-dependent oxidoreductase n=1 Tax=Pseudotamlana agarivorans TaxID=481183 RepID=A0ACC5UAY5_9FLAO|nr:molybdopterin-dependent oxidoreductase [Tamlana agarivorans]MBU2951355.1 molybdopterin-dependent oxidoreductase [Tamlana agarivorans]
MKKKEKKINRRQFVKQTTKGFVGVHMASILPASLLAASGFTSAEASSFHGVCYHDCPDSCSWVVKVQKGKVISFGGDKANPFTAGKLCGKMDTFPQDITYHSDRLLTPMKRVGKKGEGKFEPISWEKAIQEIGNQLKETIKRHGSESILSHGYMGTQSLVQKSVMSSRFFARMEASVISHTICGGAVIPANFQVNGTVMGVLPEDMVHSRYIILWGTNTKNSNIHQWPYVLKARKSGAKIIVIDPFVSATAKEADWHIQPLPGTDVALAMGMINIMIDEGLVDQDYIDNYTLGYKDLKEHVKSYDPKSVSDICGLQEEDIIQLAREYANGEPSLIRILVGIEHNYNGGDGTRAVAILPSLTGAWRKLGGGLMHLTFEMGGRALNWERLSYHRQMPTQPKRKLNMVQIGQILNNADLNPAIKSIFIFNSNPMVTTPNANLTKKGLEREDLLTVVLEHFMTETAKYADYVFPATTQLEHWDIGDSWGQVYININQPAIAPLGEAKSNSEFFRLMALEMNYTEECFEESDKDIVKSAFDSDHPYLEGIDFDYMQKHGWARYKIPEPFLPHADGNFETASGKCEFISPSRGLPKYKEVSYTNEEKAKYPLQLLTIKNTKGFHNSSHANIKHLQQKEGRLRLDIHPEDSNARNIQNGDELMVFNQRGKVLLKAKVTKRTRPGVICMPHGFWPSLTKGGQVSNNLTDDRLTDIGGGAALQDCRVQVTKT